MGVELDQVHLGGDAIQQLEQPVGRWPGHKQLLISKHSEMTNGAGMLVVVVVVSQAAFI
jgi:hypothetical protein